MVLLKSADDGTFQLQVKSDQTINRYQITLLNYSPDKLQASTADPADLPMHSVISKFQSSLQRKRSQHDNFEVTESTTKRAWGARAKTAVAQLN